MTVLLYGQEDAGLAPHWHTLQNQVQKSKNRIKVLAVIRHTGLREW